jgi:hypothetical protein
MENIYASLGENKLRNYVSTYEWLQTLSSQEFESTRTSVFCELIKIEQEGLALLHDNSALYCILYKYLEVYERDGDWPWNTYGDAWKRRKEFAKFLIYFFLDRGDIQHQKIHRISDVEKSGSTGELKFQDGDAEKDFRAALQSSNNLRSILPQYLMADRELRGEYDTIPGDVSHLCSYCTRYSLTNPSRRLLIEDWYNEVTTNDEIEREIIHALTKERERFFRSDKMIWRLESLIDERKVSVIDFVGKGLSDYHQFQESFSKIHDYTSTWGRALKLEQIWDCVIAIKEQVKLKHLLLEKGFEMLELTAAIDKFHRGR